MGVPKNIEEARKWYQLSAQLGNSSAQIGLARLDQALVQHGVASNMPPTGLPLQNVSSVYVDKTQQDIKTETVQGGENYLLGIRHESGIGVPKSIEEAKKYYRLSADQGNALAKARLLELGKEVKDNDSTSRAVIMDSSEKSVKQTTQVPVTEFMQKKEVRRAGKSVSSALQGDLVLDFVEKKMPQYSYRTDMVTVIFEAKGDVNSALANIKTAMSTRDPGGVMNPYWIVNFAAEQVSTKTNCGVITGQWYARGFPYRAPWEQIMYQAFRQNAQLAVYLYSPGRELIAEDPNFQSDAFKQINKICFKNKFNAQTLITKATGTKVPQVNPSVASKIAISPSTTSDQVNAQYAVSKNTQETVRPINTVDARKYLAALKKSKPLAEQGNPLAQFMLGASYASGQGVPQDYSQAFLWYRKAAEQGEMNAQNNLGTLYNNGQGVPQDFDQAALWFHKAAEQGEINAQNNLGALYNNGQGVPRNFDQAALWFRKAANQGLADAQNNLGGLYAQGRGVPKDFDQAAVWWSKAADQGLADAQNNLGVLYAGGRGVPQDFGQAVHWIRKAADQGHADAQKFLGILYVNGQGVPQNYVEAAKWYRKAADQGNASAQYSLGFMYSRGLGVPRDPAQAELWRRKAADQGYELAQPNPLLNENVAKTIIAGIAVGVTVLIIKDVLDGGSVAQVLNDNSSRELERREAFYEEQRKKAERREKERRYEQGYVDP
jgi:TPR repeat protein